MGHGGGGAIMTPCYRIDPATGDRVAIVEPPAEGPRCTRCGGAITAAYVRQCLNFGVRLSLICGRCRSPYGRGGRG